MAAPNAGFCIRFMGCSRIPYLLTLDFDAYTQISFLNGKTDFSWNTMEVVDGNLEVAIPADGVPSLEQLCSYIMVMDKPE